MDNEQIFSKIIELEAQQVEENYKLAEVCLEIENLIKDKAPVFEIAGTYDRESEIRDYLLALEEIILTLKDNYIMEPQEIEILEVIN